jgi:hypothetical protein
MEISEAQMAEMKKQFEQVKKIREVLSSYFEKEDLEVGAVISVLMTMLVDTLKHTGTPAHHAILMFGTIVATHYDGDDEEDEADDNEDDEKGVMQWLN